MAENSSRWKKFNHRKKPPGRKIKRELVATEKDPGSLNPTTATPSSSSPVLAVCLCLCCAHTKRKQDDPFLGNHLKNYVRQGGGYEIHCKQEGRRRSEKAARANGASEHGLRAWLGFFLPFLARAFPPRSTRSFLHGESFSRCLGDTMATFLRQPTRPEQAKERALSGTNNDEVLRKRRRRRGTLQRRGQAES